MIGNRALEEGRLASLIPADMHTEPHRQATRMVALAAQEGFDAVRVGNAREWDAIWRGRVVLLGAGFDTTLFRLQDCSPN